MKLFTYFFNFESLCTKSSVISNGSIDPNLILCIPSILLISSSKSISPYLFLKSLPYDAICIPVITTSFIPWSAIFFISFKICSGSLLLTLPLAYGIIQYEQNLSHPS